MAMDFFEHQERAQKKSVLLVVYYVFAVILIMVAVYMTFALTFIGVSAKASPDADLVSFWNLDLFVWVVGGTLLLVVSGSVYKVSQLAGGGSKVAEMLGGRLVGRSTRDKDERKILNVVEEMAIASGLPVPPVYIMDEEGGINAFAAGFQTSDAIIAVTRGCVQQLTRDELQGVIAHEFSHILNGDMKMNIRLTGVLHGILLISLLGYFIFRTMLFSRSRENKGKIPIVLLGIILWIIGYVGIIFGKMIKSAVSRQREFLADASAVQFTRNPDGIAGALKKIGGFKAGSTLASPHAEEASHFFFCNGLTSSFSNLMATHPPLSERIKRIDASFKGQSAAVASSPAAEGAAGFAGAAVEINVRPKDVTASVGTLNLEHLAYASAVLKSIPDRLVATAREAYGARAVIYALLLNDEERPKNKQLSQLAEHADEGIYNETIKLAKLTAGLAPELRLPLADMAVASLRELSAAQYKVFIANMEQLVIADEEIDLFEYTLQKMVIRNLDPVFGKPVRHTVRYKEVEQVKDSCSELISCLAHWGADVVSEAELAFSAAASDLGIQIQMITSENCGLSLLDSSLDELSASSPLLKKRILSACTACIAYDGKVTIEEGELLRAVADALGCPVPPFLAGEIKEAIRDVLQ